MNKLDILYEDNHIIVVVKPFNVLSQGDSTGDKSMLEYIKEYIKEKYNKPGAVYLGLVHRLDRPVGGIMVFAKTSKAASRLTKEFNNHNIIKKYYAIVKGHVVGKGRFVDKIEKNTKNGNSFISKNGKEAILEYEEVKYDANKDCTLVSIDLKTGRHHQIRVQFASRGHSLVGDHRYGDDGESQICLFSYYLSFMHPVSKELMKFEIDIPKFGNWTLFTS